MLIKKTKRYKEVSFLSNQFMMNTKKTSFLVVFFLSFSMQSQTITLEFPKFAGKTFEFILFQGDKSIKIYQNDTIPKDGVVKLVVPKEYEPYTGMCRWLLTNSTEGGGLDMAIPGFGYKVSCFSDKPNESNIQWNGYDAMNELNRLSRTQKQIIEKFETMSTAAKLYNSKDALYGIFLKEKEVQVKAYEEFHKILKTNANYNARFLPIVNLTNGIPLVLTDDYDQRAKYVNEYISKELNFDHLYTSGHWTGILQSWVELNVQFLANKESFVQNFTTISHRITAPKKYTDFVGKVTYFLTQYGKDDYIAAIAPEVIRSGKITSYEGNTMQVYVKALQGSRAPDLIIPKGVGKFKEANSTTIVLKSSDLATSNYMHTLLVFYRSGCGPCEELMQQLPSHYKMLKKKGVRIITLSADENELEYMASSKNYPWVDKYCDFEGLKGVNFKNYAVLATPTMYLLDSKGIIVEKFATMKQLLDWSER